MPNTIRVGDRDLTVTTFSGFKFLEAQNLVSHMLEVVPDLDEDMATFYERFRASNPTLELNRATADLVLRQNSGWISDEAWEKSDGKVTYTPQPDGMRLALRLYPVIQKHARRDLENLIALIVTPNSELEEADEEGADLYAKDGPVGRMRRYVLHKGSITQMAQLAVAAGEALVEEFAEGDMGEAVGKLLGTWRTLTGKATTPSSTESETAARSSSTSSSGRTPARSRAKKSSTASPTGS